MVLCESVRVSDAPSGEVTVVDLVELCSAAPVVPEAGVVSVVTLSLLLFVVCT